MKNYFVPAFFLVCILFFPFDTYSRNATVFYPGEHLEYEVSFYGVKLGKIKVDSYAEEALNGAKVYKAKIYVDSYRGIPFVDLHATFESWMDKSLSYSHKFAGNMKAEDGFWCYQKIGFDYNANKMRNQKWKEKEVFFDKEQKISSKVCDGCALFFLARQYSDIKRSARILTVMDVDLCNTNLNFYAKKENVEIGAVKYPVKTLYLDGKADWKGLYGLTGKFQGWFSDDDASIPIKAKMNVYVGNVLIELVSWKRGSWAPPRG